MNELPPLLRFISTIGDVRAIYDVQKLARELPRKYKPLSRIANRYLTTHSWNADLTVAEEYVKDAIRWHKTGRKSLLHAKTALVQSAIVGYARVFDTSSNYRSDLKLGEILDVDQTVFHNKLLRLRHEALAHFGPEGTDKAWNEDFCFVVREGLTWQTAVLARRSSFEQGLAIRLAEHLANIGKIVFERLCLLRKEFQAEIERVWESDENFERVLRGYEINPSIIGGWNGPILSDRANGGRKIETF